MQPAAGIVVPSTNAPTELIIGVFLIALVIVCVYFFMRRNK